MKKILLFLSMTLVIMLSSCSDDAEESNITIENPAMEMVAGDSKEIIAKSLSALSYVAEDEYYASVDNHGMVKANRIGETKIFVENEHNSVEVSVVIKPKYTTYADPDLAFGETRTDVVAKYGTPASNTNESVTYDDYSIGAPTITYTFDGKDDNSKLIGIGILVRTSYTEELNAYLSERFAMTKVSGENTSIGTNNLDPSKATVAVSVSVYDPNYLRVAYYVPSEAK